MEEEGGWGGQQKRPLLVRRQTYPLPASAQSAAPKHSLDDSCPPGQSPEAPTSLPVSCHHSISNLPR